jgi:hypothetical protein
VGARAREAAEGGRAVLESRSRFDIPAYQLGSHGEERDS